MTCSYRARSIPEAVTVATSRAHGSAEGELLCSVRAFSKQSRHTLTSFKGPGSAKTRCPQFWQMKGLSPRSPKACGQYLVHPFSLRYRTAAQDRGKVSQNRDLPSPPGGRVDSRYRRRAQRPCRRLISALKPLSRTSRASRVQFAGNELWRTSTYPGPNQASLVN